MALREWFRRQPRGPEAAGASINAHVTSWGDAGWNGLGTTRDDAMRVSTVYACVRKLAEQMASFPAVVVQKTDAEGRMRRIPLPDHAVSRLLRKPNTLQSGFEFVEQMVQWLTLHGVAYAEIIRDNAGRPIRLWPIPPSLVTVTKAQPRGADMTLVYRIQGQNDQHRTLETGDVLHLRGLYSDWLCPVSPIQYQASLIQTSAALSTHEHNTFARNGVAAGGIIRGGPRTSEKDGKALLRTWNSSTAGPTNSGRWVFMPHGTDAEPLKISNADAQLLQLMGYGRVDICTIFGVPPEIIGVNEHSKYASAQAAGQFFFATTLRPLIERVEAAFRRDLMPGSASLDLHFDASSIMRASPTEETAMHVQRVQGGVETPNEARLALGHDIVEDDAADSLYIQMNQEPVSEVGSDASTDEDAALDGFAAQTLIRLAEGT